MHPAPPGQETGQNMAKLTGPKLISNGQLSKTGEENTIIFQYNPKTITLTQSVSLSQAASATGQSVTVQPTIDALGLPSLKMDTVFNGSSTCTNCDQLMAWNKPTVASKTAGGKPSCPPLEFQWCNFSVYGIQTISATMTSVDITYERFQADGTPIRASVKLNLKPEDQSAGQPPQQNPTSGGLPGRSGHVMISGETPPGIALNEYGDPGNWRALAEANQLDDPLRMRPGDSLYLPSRAELDGGGVHQ